jgi:uroporphyrinogen-III synthase
MGAEALVGARLAVVGPGTAAALKELLGREADLCAEEHLGDSLAQELLSRHPQRVLVPQAEQAREALVRILRAGGIEVEAIVAYRTIMGSGGVDLPRLLQSGDVDAVVFASPSAVHNMRERLAPHAGSWELLSRLCVACIGPVTAAAAERQGLRVDVVARRHTLRGMVDGLAELYEKRRRSGEESA